MKFSPGDRVGIYEIMGVLGAGGMGQVFRARDTQLGRDVAIKVLSEEYARNEGRLKRFLAEAKATSALNHPNILTVYGIGGEEQNPYIVTEYIDGDTLRALLLTGPLPIERAINIALQTLAGLGKAHSIGIIHRDLKPENLMITRDGFVKILDFGLAKLLKADSSSGSDRPLESLGITATETGLIVGTAAYMSPEQARGQHADARSDIFSLGLILYEMIAGENPFRRPSAVDTISSILRDPAPPISAKAPHVSSQLGAIIEKSIQKVPADRYASVQQLESELRAIRNQMPSSEAVPTMTYLSKSEEKPIAQARASETQVVGHSRKYIWISTLILLAIAATAVFFEVIQRSAKPAISGPPVIAVMAIENQTTDPEFSKIDVGRILSDAFVQILYDSKGVQVVSPFRIQSVVMGLGRRYADTAHDLDLVQKVCDRAQANTVLSGSLSQLGDTFILTATLTAVQGDKLLGSFRAESQGKKDLLPSLTSGIAANLNQALSSAMQGQMAMGRDVSQVATNNVEAYSHFMNALDLNNEGRWMAGADELQKALAIDPNMGIAWSELACSYSFGGDEAKSQEAQNRALHLRPRMSRKERLWVDSISLWLDGNGAAYRAAVEKFVQEFPDDRNGYLYVGLGWQWLDHNCIEALKWYEKGYALTPDYYPMTKAMVDCQLELGQKDKAAASLQRYMKYVGSGYGFDQAKARLDKITKS